MIRALGSDDLEIFMALWLIALAECPGAFGDDELSAKANAQARWSAGLRDNPRYGFFDEGLLVGVVGIGSNALPKKKHISGIGPLYVASDYRGRGIAQQLMQHAIACLPPHVELVRLGVNARSANVLRLYERLGFTSWGTEPKALKLEDGSYADIIWMSRQK